MTPGFTGPTSIRLPRAEQATVSERGDLFKKLGADGLRLPFREFRTMRERGDGGLSVRAASSEIILMKRGPSVVRAMNT